MPQLSIFLTDLGWFGLLGDDRAVAALAIGHASPADVRLAVKRGRIANGRAAGFDEADWFPELRRRLQQYSGGVATDFSDIELQFPHLTAFQRKVVAATRRIGHGRTLTYGQLAQRAGSPRAARAVGSVMASNRFPIIVPCHRVVASNGKLGGFSAPQGVSLKQRMLALEADAGVR